MEVFSPAKYKQYPKYRRQETKKKNEIKYIGSHIQFYNDENHQKLKNCSL